MLSDMVCAGGRHSRKSMSGGITPEATRAIKTLAELTSADKAMTLQASIHAPTIAVFMCSRCMIIIMPMRNGWPLFRNAQLRSTDPTHRRPWSRVNAWHGCLCSFAHNRLPTPPPYRSDPANRAVV
jgi:hypothetical protein